MKIDNISTVPVDPVRIESTGVGSVAIAQASTARGREVETPRKTVQKETRSTEEIKKDISAINDQLKTLNRAVQFNIDEKTHTIVARIVDTETGEVIRQIPPENIVRLRDNDMTGLLIGKKV